MMTDPRFSSDPQLLSALRAWDDASRAGDRSLEIAMGIRICLDKPVSHRTYGWATLTCGRVLLLYQGDLKAAESFFGTNLEDLDDPEKLLAQMQEQESSGRYLGIGADWHALHFLLTGDGDLKPHPLPPPPLGARSEINTCPWFEEQAARSLPGGEQSAVLGVPA